MNNLRDSSINDNPDEGRQRMKNQIVDLKKFRRNMVERMAKYGLEYLTPEELTPE